MIYRFRSFSEAPFNDFISDNYEQQWNLYKQSDNIKRFMLLYPDYWENLVDESWKNNPDPDINIDKDPFKKVSLKETWKPLEVKLYSRAKARKIGDISSLDGSNSPIFSEKALEVLCDLLEDNGEFLELNCVSDGKTYYLYHVLTYVDILNPYKSGVVRKDHNMFFWYFKENVDFDKLSIFRVIHPKINGNFISKTFMERCLKNKLTGIIPWEDIPFISESVINKNQLGDFKNFQDIIYSGENQLRRRFWHKDI